MLLRISTVCELVGVCRSTVYRWVSEGCFPEPIKIRERSVRWKIDDIQAWRNTL
ncbi:MAG: AlpA family phage regulatory protein [Gammaproteobacteria bacterium]|nr:AlpA family phage regulatory protein [Gammaproteobacteria bacterium]